MARVEVPQRVDDRGDRSDRRFERVPGGPVGPQAGEHELVDGCRGRLTGPTGRVEHGAPARLDPRIEAGIVEGALDAVPHEVAEG